VTTCGDGIIAGAEICDDDNSDAGDGCDAGCLVESGYSCDMAPSLCVTTCGDGIIAGNEECDDDNPSAGDGCDAQCAVEAGYTCLAEPSACATVCGDGIIAGNEGCDDSDSAAGDGCGATCAVENGYACTGVPSACATVCGDGKIVAAETCDDGDTDAGDGCDASCAPESGYTCTGMPSTCATTCGDALVAGTEACDDGGTLPGDGCTATCTVQNGYTCTGVPSACVTTCGDSVVAGAEICDDGNVISGDGCSSGCTPNTGETCADPLVMSQATQAGGVTTWTVATGSVVTVDGDVACDPNTKGPDVVVAYVKTSDTVANGGKLLHVKADTPSTTATSGYLNVEIKGGACAAGAGTSLKCLWYKDNWDSYLDVPPGTYYIWVQKNSPTTATVFFPAVTIAAEEIAPAMAEGEACFAPYTSASSIYTAPAGAGLPHSWLIPPTINSFDMGATWGAPGSISCDNSSPYGDIHGVDAVIEFDKQSATSVLKVDVQNLDPTLTQSDLDVEVLSVCDPNNAAKVSRNCRANKDTVSITAPSPAGPVYLWVSTEGTAEELNGANVQITEIFPAPGESWPTAEPLAGSGPITATSAMRLDAPSCFPAAGNIHWFKYTLSNDALSLKANSAGVVGIYDEGGQELKCVGDAAGSPIGILGDPGTTFYIAVQSPSPITSLTMLDIAYNGVGGVETDMQITFPSSALSEFGMTVSGTELFMGNTSLVFSFAKTVGATAVEHGAAEGITTTHLGYDLVFAGGSLFSVDSTTIVSASRLFRIYNGTTWGPAAWDITPTYPASSASYALATDGTNTLFMSTRRTTVSANFYSFSTVGAAGPTLLGTNTNVWYVVGLAADDQYFYFASNGTTGEGIYRLSRSNVAGPVVKLASIDTDTQCNNIEVDAFVNPQYLYVRDALGDVHAIASPAAATPIHIGVVSSLGTTSDYAMTFDKTDGSLYLFETETDAAGRIVKIQ